MQCKKCKINKLEKDFEKGRRDCKSCRNEQKRESDKNWRRKHPEVGSRYGKLYYKNNKGEIRKRNMQWQKEHPDRVRHHSLMSSHGISLEEYNQKIEEQDGKCDICHQPESRINKRTGKTKFLCVDHNHETGKVRGLLCDDCNIAIGKIKENIETLENAKKYLQKYKEL